MDNLKELGAIWQNFQPGKYDSSKINLMRSDVIKKLRKTENKHFRINLVKTVSVGLCLILLSYTILNQTGISILTKIALGWIIVSLSVGMVIYWKKQFNASQLHFINDSESFIESTIIKLKSQKQIITHLLPAIVFCLVIGINLIYFDLLKEEDISLRLIAHFTISIMLFGVMYLGLIVRKRRFNTDFKPLIEEFELIKMNFKNHE